MCPATIDCEFEGVVEVEWLAGWAGGGFGDRQCAGGVGDGELFAVGVDDDCRVDGGVEAGVGGFYDCADGAGWEFGDGEWCIDGDLAVDGVAWGGEAGRAGDFDVEEFGVEVGAGGYSVEDFVDGEFAGVTSVRERRRHHTT